MKKQKEIISPQEYIKFLSNLKLQNIYPNSILLVFNEESIQQSLNISVDEDSNFIQDGKNLKINYHVILNAINEDSKNIAMNVDVSFVVKYVLEQEQNITNELFKVFIDNSVNMLIWPYFRELVQSSTGRFGLPPLILPLKVNLPKSNAQKK